MIKASELKIGNFIFDDDGALCKVIGFKPYEHSVRCDEEEGCDILIDIYGADGKVRSGYAVESTLANSIPLTPEWMERCGFEWENGYMKKSLIYAKMKLGFYAGAPYKMSLFQTTIPGEGSIEKVIAFGENHPEYVHQLQNLYFALTGEELVITQPVS